MKKVTIILALIMATTVVNAQHMDHSAAMGSNNNSSKAVVSSKYLALNQAMRKLWSDHMHWTLATVDAFFNEPRQLETKLNRLLANQKEIGAAIVPYYGQAAGDKLAQLLTEHIQLAVPVLKAAQANDKTSLDIALANWYKNAKEIADFLSAANPKNWPASATEPALKMHITHTTGYAVNILKGDYASSVKGFEEALNHMLMLADILTDGIAKQFPEKFSNGH
jgi:hypothetical protein